MPKLFEVEVTMVMVVAAEDEGDAYYEARGSMRDCLSDIGQDTPDVTVMGEIKSVSQLDKVGQGWEPDCLPYGDNQNMTIEAILKENAE